MYTIKLTTRKEGKKETKEVQATSMREALKTGLIHFGWTPEQAHIWIDEKELPVTNSNALKAYKKEGSLTVFNDSDLGTYFYITEARVNVYENIKLDIE